MPLFKINRDIYHNTLSTASMLQVNPWVGSFDVKSDVYSAILHIGANILWGGIPEECLDPCCAISYEKRGVKG